MKIVSLIPLFIFFSAILWSCKKEPVHLVAAVDTAIVDSILQPSPPIDTAIVDSILQPSPPIDISGVYFGTYSLTFSGNGISGGSTTSSTSNCYLVATGYPHQHQFKVFSDSLLSHQIWLTGFSTNDNPIDTCGYYIHSNSSASAQITASLTLKHCDSIFVYTSRLQQNHQTEIKYFRGSKWH